MTMPTRCQRCHEEIPAERLEALPDTSICVKCSRDIGGEFVVQAVPHNIGKQGSLKKNYGDWTIVKHRKRIPPKPT